MAIGDAAAAAGLEVVPATQQVSQGFARINQKGDELAAEQTARLTLAGVVAAKVAKADVIAQTDTPANIAGSGFSGRIWLKPV
jgi:hypothetical protein